MSSPSHGSGISSLGIAAMLVASIALSTSTPAADFIRGDANSDGSVTVSDAHAIARAVASGGSEGGCLDAVDANDDGATSRDDALRVLDSLLGGGAAPPPPFETAGADPSEDGLDCPAYGGGSPLEDPAAMVELRDAVHEGGHHRDGFLTLAISSSTALAGYSVTLVDRSGIIENAGISAGLYSDRTGTFDPDTGYMGIARDPADSRRFRLGVVNSLDGAGTGIPPGEDAAVLAIAFCLREGAPAGDHRIVVEAAELIDLASGRAIRPFEVSGTVQLADATEPGLACGLPIVPGSRPFLRGDSNGDRTVTVSDTVQMFGWFFLGSAEPPCLVAGDANDDGALDIADPIVVLMHVFVDARAIPQPYPSPGLDPTPDDELTCLSWGSGQPIDDPAARIEVASAAAAGGADRVATIALAVSSSFCVGGLSARVVDQAGVLEDGGLVRLLPGAWRTDPGSWDGAGSGFTGGAFADGRMDLGVVGSFVTPTSLPAGDAVAAVEIWACVKPGTPAGEYPIVLEAGELSPTSFGDACPECDGCVGSAVVPALVGGTLRVGADVASAACDPEPPPPPEDIHILFKLEDAFAVPGGAVSVPFIVKADRATSGFSYSIDFDEEVLRATATRRLWQKPGGTPYEFERFEMDSSDAHPGNDGLDEGYLAGAAIFSLTDTGAVLPVDEEVDVLRFDFTVASETTAERTELVFLDGGRSSTGDPVTNKLLAGGQDITPSMASSFVFVNGRINIVPEGTPFIRGDANRDDGVNIADPNFTLNFLFLGGIWPACPDATDANDDGKLDISDAILTLQFLFLGGTTMPAPFPAPGADPTGDDLAGCI